MVNNIRRLIKIVTIIALALLVSSAQVYGAFKWAVVQLPVLKAIWNSVTINMEAWVALVKISINLTASAKIGKGIVISIGSVMPTWGNVFIGLFIALAGFVVLVLLSILAFWHPNKLLFLLIAGVSIALAGPWYVAFNNPTGLTISMVFIAYSLISFNYSIKELSLEIKD